MKCNVMYVCMYGMYGMRVCVYVCMYVCMYVCVVCVYGMVWYGMYGMYVLM